MPVQSQIEAAVARVSTGSGVADRRRVGPAEDALRALQVQIARTFVQDTDVAPGLLLLALALQRKELLGAAEALTDLPALIVEASRDAIDADPRLPSRVRGLLAAEPPGTEQGRAAQVNALRVLLRNSTQQVDDPDMAAEECVSRLADVLATLTAYTQIVERAPVFLANVTRANLPAVLYADAHENMRRATVRLAPRLELEAAAVALSAASSATVAQKRKHNDSVTVTAFSPAQLSSTALPSHTSGQATVSCGGTSGTIDATATPAVLNLSIPPQVFYRSVYAYKVGTGAGAAFAISAVLRGRVVPGSIQVQWTSAGALATGADNGLGGVTSGAITGTIDYATGVLSALTSSNADTGTGVVLSYAYWPLSSLRSYDASGVQNGTFRSFRVLVTNTAVSVDLPLDGGYNTLSALAAALDTALDPHGVVVTASGNTLTLTTAATGSGTRLCLAADTAAVSTEGPVAPLWDSLPASLNAALGAVRAQATEVRGRDAFAATLVRAAAIESLTSIEDGSSTLEAFTGSVATPFTSVPVGALVQAGDYLDVFSPVPQVCRVSSVAAGVATIEPILGFASTPVGVGTVTVQGEFRRPRTRLVSTRPYATGALTTSFPGVGFTGSAYPLVTELELGAAVTAGTVVRPGDFLEVELAPISYVTGVNGSRLRMGPTCPYPLTSAVVSSGMFVSADEYVARLRSLHNANAILADFAETMSTVLMAIGSGSLHADAAIREVGRAATAISDACALLPSSAAPPNALTALLRALRSDGKTAVAQALLELRLGDAIAGAPPHDADALIIVQEVANLVDDGTDLVLTSPSAVDILDAIDARPYAEDADLDGGVYV